MPEPERPAGTTRRRGSESQYFDGAIDARRYPDGKQNRRPPRRQVPAGHKEITFFIPDELHAKARRLADADERETVDDYARVIFARYLRKLDDEKGSGD